MTHDNAAGEGLVKVEQVDRLPDGRTLQSPGKGESVREALMRAAERGGSQ